MIGGLDAELAHAIAPKPRWWLIFAGLVIVLAGAFLAQLIRTTDGTTVRDIRFTGTNGTVMSALLYVPKNATPTTPAPGILAVHGYINSRETQDGFAIEFARRGYVVLSLDQTGHGYSQGAAFANGFGGPVRFKGKRDKEFKEVPLTHGHTEQGRGIGAADIAYAIQTGRPHRANGDLGYHVLEAMWAFHEASDSGTHYNMTSTVERPAPLRADLPEDELDA